MPDTDSWLIVGLGNPGPQYELTPHNLGFLVIDRLAIANDGIRVTRPESQALVGVGSINRMPSVLAKPQTFMNLSGPSVKGLLAKYEVDPSRMIVIYDDLDLEWKSLRIRPNGSSGGHHGMDSVIKAVGTSEFPRVRLGIDWGRSDRNGAKFVLSQFGKAQMQDLDELLDYTSRAVESMLAEGVEKAMTKYNRRAPGLNEDK